MGNVELPWYVTKAIVLYERVQVELHGKYSVERVGAFYKYQQSHTAWQCVFILILTPLPCLAIIVLTDLVPLHPPTDGYSHNIVHFIRVFFVGFAIGAALLEQARHFVAGLPMSRSRVWGVSLFLSGLSTAYAYLMTTLIGFPLPFTIILCAPCFCSSLGITILVLWGSLLREDEVMRHDLIAYIKIMAIQFGLTTVYPAYNFVFIQLTGIQQTIIAVLLPLIKLVAKNAISYVFSAHLEDFRPEVIIFNVEVFHALFVSCCMQNSRSWTTTIALMGLDFIHSWSGLHDVENLLRPIHEMETKLCGQCDGTPLSLVDKTLYYVHHDDAVKNNKNIRLRSMTRIPVHTAVIYPVTVDHHPVLHENTTRQDDDDDKSVGIVQKIIYMSSATKYKSSKRQISEAQRRNLDVLSTTERIGYVTNSLHVLHLAEFLLLVEFVEVIIPVVYCVYLTAMFYLPNRVYYPQLDHMDTHSLLSNMSNTLGYAALEFISFILFCMALKRKLAISPLHQVAFVVHKQWNLVQSKLILWVVFVVNTSLVHFGYDYSFRFTWLRHK